MKHTKQLFMILLVVFLLIGLGTLAASDVTKNDTSVTKSAEVTKTNTVSKDTTSASKVQATQKNNDNTKIVNTKPNSKTDEIITNKTIKKTNSSNKKTTPITYTVNNFNQLNTYLTTGTYDTVTLNINSNIDLAGNTTVNSTIKTLTINGNRYVINGQNQYQFLKINHNTITTINNINIQNCNATNGGAISNNGNLTITNSNLTNNNATLYGGAIRNNGTLILRESILNLNNATYGGAIYNYGNLSIINNTLNNNTATDNRYYNNGDGGAIYNNGNINITRSNFNYNFAGYSGGAIDNRGNLTLSTSTLNNNIGHIIGGAIINSEGNMTITQSILNNNIAHVGGAIDNHNSGNLTISGSILNNNTATDTTLGGGAINNYGNLNIINDTINNNNASNGGAIRHAAGNLTITRSNLDNNNATISGGAIYNFDKDLEISYTAFNNNIAPYGGAICTNKSIYTSHNISLSLRNVTIRNNVANSGGAIFSNQTFLNITKSLFVTNTATIGGAIFTNRSTVDIKDSLFEDNTANVNSTYHMMGGGAIYSENSNVTITNGTFTGNVAKNVTRVTNANGGAICMDEKSTLTINNSNLTNNNATLYGGAIRNNGTLILRESILNLNNATYGGAIYNYGNLSIINNTLNNNTATDNRYYNNGDGGAIYNNGNINITRSNFNYNFAGYSGGAIDNRGNLTLSTSTLNNNIGHIIGGAIINSEGNMTITQSILNNNIAHVGGAIDNHNSGNLTISGSILNNNTATDTTLGGGAINNYGNLNIINDTINNNNASNGGAIRHAAGNLTITRSNLDNNNATISGGAIYNFDKDLEISYTAFNNNIAPYGGAICTNKSIYTSHNISLSLRNVTIRNNVANSGGAIFSNQTFLNITKSLFVTNTATIGGAIFTNRSTVDIKDSLFEDNTANVNSTYHMMGGGAIYSEKSNITIDNGTFTKNTAKNITINIDADGGAICLNENSTLTIKYSNLTHNTASVYGGAINYPRSILTIKDSNLTHNNASIGGAIYNFYYGNATIINSNLTHNNAHSGGAIGNHGTLNINNTNLQYNTATNSDGGAIINTGTLNINNTNLQYNNATHWGGAIQNWGTLNINNTNLTHNNATDGGAINNYGSTLNINNTNLNNNNATFYGGAISNNFGTLNINNTNLNNNNASIGGAIINYYGNTTIINSNLTHNNATEGGAIYSSSNSSTIITQSNLTHNNASNGGAIGCSGNLTIENSNFYDNVVTGDSEYVVDFSRADYVKIIDSYFENNTDNIRDMLFSDAYDGAVVDIHGNTYIDNYLATNMTQIENETVRVLDDVTYLYPVNVTVRSIYNHTINSGSVYVKSDKIDDDYSVRNNATIISVKNSLLELPVNQIDYNYTSIRKHYQGAKTSFEIYKHVPTYLSIDLTPDDNVNVGEIVHVKITLVDVDNNKLSGREISVIINGKNYTLDKNTTDDNGEINFDYTVPGFIVNGIPGLLEFEAEHHESLDSYYDSAQTVEKPLLINKNSTHIHIDYLPSDAVIGNTFNVTIKLCEDQTSHNTISGQKVFYNITSIDGNTLISSGNNTTTRNGFNVTINEIPIEGYIVNAWFEETTLYYGTSGWEKIVPGKIGTETEVIVSGNAYINQTKEITIRILDTQENPIPDGSIVLVKINDQEARDVPVRGGEYKFNYSSPISEKITITATFLDTSFYSGSSGTGNYTVVELPTHTTLNVTNKKVENTTIIAYINDTIYNKVVNGGTLTLTENGIPLQTKDVINGTVVFTIRGLKAGEHELEAYYSGVNQVYVQSQQTTRIFDVEKTKTQTHIDPINVLVSDESVNINITVTDENNKPVQSGTINITIGTTTYTNIEVKDGKANKTINNLPADTYHIKIAYNGDETYHASNNETTLTVNKIPTTTTIEILDTTLTNVTIKVTVTNTTGEPVTKGNITILNELGYEITNLENTNLTNGEATIKIPAPSAETIIIKVRYNENDIYQESYAKNQTNGENIPIPVTKIPTTTNIEILNNTLDNVTIKVTVTNKTGKLVTHGNFVVYYQNNIIASGSVPGGEGIAKLPLTIGENIPITVRYLENEIYNQSDANELIKVDKIPTITNVEILDTTLTNVTIKVTVTNSTGKLVTKGDITILNSDKLPITGLIQKTLIDGELIVNLPSQYAGEKINITVHYNENDIYQASNAINETTGQPEIKITVEKIPTKTTVEILDTTLTNVTIRVTTTNMTNEPVTTGTVTILNENNIPITTLENIQLDQGEATIKIPATSAGPLKIKVQYNENDIYKASNAINETTGEPIITLDVTKIPTTTTIEVLNNTLTNVTIKVTTTNKTGDKVTTGTITIKDKTGKTLTTQENINLENGEATVKLNITQAGETIIQVQYNENEIYNESYATNKTTGQPEITIPVDKIPTKTTIEILDTTLTNVTIKVTTTNMTNTPVTTGTITILNENNMIIKGNINLNNGETTITIPATTAGPLKIKVQYNENNIYKASNAKNQTNGENIPIPVTKIPTTTTITVNGNTVKNINATGRVTDKFNKPVTEGTVIIRNGNTEVGRATISNGLYNIPLNINTQGRYNLVAQYMGTNTYLPSNSTTATVNINPIDTKISANIPDPTKDNTTIKVNLTDKDGKAIPKAPVNITLPNGTTIPTTTDNNGIASVPVNLPVGQQSIKVSYPGNGTYKASNTTLNVNIGKIPTTTTGRVLNNTAGNVIVTGTVKDKYGRNVPEGTVSIKTGNTEIGKATVTNGVFTTTTTINTGGNYPITLQYLGTNTYLPSNANLGSVTVTPRASQITGKPEGNIAETTNVTVTLKDPETGKPIPNAPITVTLPNGSKVTGTTGTDGTVKVPVDLPKGNNKAKIDYPGNSTYKPSTTTIDVPVTGKTPTIQVTPEGNKVGKTNVTTTLKDPITGKPVPNAPITVTLLNGSKVTGTTGNDGTVKVPVDLREGLNTVTVTYTGNGTYNPISDKTTFNISKNPVNITLNPIKGVIGEKITLTAYITDEDGNPISGGNLAFKLNGKTLRSDGRFDSNAPAMKFSVKDGKVTYTINADLYLRNAKNLTAAYSGNYKFEETGSETVEAQIQKRYAGVTLTVTPTQNKQYDTIKFTATVRDTTKNGKNQTLINQNTSVMFKVNGNTLRDKNGQIIYVPVNANKQATYNYVIPAGTGGITANKLVRDYKVEAIFVGINYYPGARNNSIFNVERSPTTVTITQARVNTGNVLSVKATLKDFKGNNLIGTNKVTVKINGRSYIDPKNGKPKYWSIKNGVVDLTGITVDPKTTIKRVMVVTGERQAYLEGRAETTTIVRA